jgi:hypothetical protein
MSESEYVCGCGSRIFRRYTADKIIYCSGCGKPVPKNVRFKSEADNEHPLLGT